MHKSYLITFATMIATSLSSFGAVSVNLIANSSTGLYLSSSGAALPGAEIRYGYFDSTGVDFSNYSDVADSFSQLGTTNLDSTGSLFSIGNSHPIPPASEEPQPQSQLTVWVFSEATGSASSSEWGLFTSSSWIMPTDLGLASLTSSLIGETGVIYGSKVGNNYHLVPEPSTYAMLAGALALGYVMVRRRKA